MENLSYLTHICGSLADTTTLSLSRPKTNGSEREIHTLLSSKTAATSLDSVLCHTQNTDNPVNWDCRIH